MLVTTGINPALQQPFERVFEPCTLTPLLYYCLPLPPAPLLQACHDGFHWHGGDRGYQWCQHTAGMGTAANQHPRTALRLFDSSTLALCILFFTDDVPYWSQPLFMNGFGTCEALAVSPKQAVVNMY